MADNGKLQLKALNAHGDFLGEKIDVVMRHLVLSETKKVSVTVTKPIVITNLKSIPQGSYRIEIDPPSYLAASQFVNIKSSGVTELEVVFAIDPKKVKSVVFPKFAVLMQETQKLLAGSGNVLSFIGKTGEVLYKSLDEMRRAGMLNILAKMRATPLSNKRNVLSYIQELRELRADRFFAVVSKELREETKNSVAEGLFREVSGSLHHLPGQFAGFAPAGSFKTADRYGNLQLTFFIKGDECVADIDIDDASGLEHVFQVIHNALPGNSTHPYAIHNILLAYQKLDPGYTFKV